MKVLRWKSSLPCGTYMILPSSPCLCQKEDLSDREKDEHTSEPKNKPGKLKSSEVMFSYWVVLLHCGVMHSPPVRCPFPCIPHHIIQTKAIGRKGLHLEDIIMY